MQFIQSDCPYNQANYVIWWGRVIISLYWTISLMQLSIGKLLPLHLLKYAKDWYTNGHLYLNITRFGHSVFIFQWWYLFIKMKTNPFGKLLAYNTRNHLTHHDGLMVQRKMSHVYGTIFKQSNPRQNIFFLNATLVKQANICFTNCYYLLEET